MENKTEVWTCLKTMGYEGRGGWVVRAGNNTVVQAFKGRNAYERCCRFYDTYQVSA